MIRIFIGYDPREPVAFHACVSSIIRYSSAPVCITPLALNNLSGYEELHADGSNQFIYSRFLVPALCDFGGWAIFIDGDMILKGDIAELFEMRDIFSAVQVVKHDYRTKQSRKYLGNKNEDYPRKNWSSVMLWNCGHLQNRKLTVDYVQHATGAQLHRFVHLEDRFIGALPKEWNHLVGEYARSDSAKLLHYTLGTPCFSDYENCDNSEDWHQERQIMNSHESG